MEIFFVYDSIFFYSEKSDVDFPIHVVEVYEEPQSPAKSVNLADDISESGDNPDGFFLGNDFHTLEDAILSESDVEPPQTESALFSRRKPSVEIPIKDSSQNTTTQMPAGFEKFNLNQPIDFDDLTPDQVKYVLVQQNTEIQNLKELVKRSAEQTSKSVKDNKTLKEQIQALNARAEHAEKQLKDEVSIPRAKTSKPSVKITPDSIKNMPNKKNPSQVDKVDPNNIKRSKEIKKSRETRLNNNSEDASGESDNQESNNPLFQQKLAGAQLAKQMRSIFRQELKLRDLEKQNRKRRLSNDPENVSEKSKTKKSNENPSSSVIPPLIPRDNSKFKYMLERTRNNWKTWKQLLMTELSVKELSDVLDPSIEPPAGLTSSQIKNRKNTVRGIMISHLVEIYQDQVVDIEDPVEMFDKLQKSKRDEVNETSLAVTDQLNHLRFEIAKEPFVDFERRFNEVVRKYELVAGEPLNERIQTDAFYRAVSYSIPSLKTATYADRARGKSDGFSIAEIKVFAQNFESENKNSAKQMRSGDAMMIYTAKGKLICRGCGDTGHIQAKCPNPNKKRCYKCQQLGKYKADNCPFADGKEMNGPYIPPLRRNFKPRFNNNNYQNCRYRPYNSNNSGQFRRNNYNNCLLYTSPSPRDRTRSRMPSSA